MNIVFWLLIFVALAFLWYACLPLFKHIGDAASEVAEDIKEVLKGEGNE